MTKEEKRTKILHCAAGRIGWTCDVYYDVSQELIAEGLIEKRTTFSVGGNRVDRLFLTRKAA